MDSSSLLPSSTTMNIPALYGASTYGGFNQNCVIGLYQIYFGGDNSGLFDRGVIFDARTNSFSDISVDLRTDGGGTP